MGNSGYYHLKLNNVCNCNCNFCADSIEVRREKNLDISEIKQMLLSGREKGFSNLIITGGEPTISPLLFDVISYSRNIGYDFIHLVTNARMLASVSFTNKLIQAGVNRYQVSYFAADPILFDKISGASGSFRQTSAGLNNLRDNSCNIMFNSVITKENMIYLPEMFLQMKSYNPTGIQFAFLNPTGNAMRNPKDIIPKYSEMMPYLKKIFEYARYFSFDNVFVENIPFCILGEENLSFAADNNYPPSERKLHQNWKRKDLSICNDCKFKDSCSGIWNNYLLLYGEQL